VILKSYIVEQNLKILDNYNSVLLYGENAGIKHDIKINIKNLNKDSEIINFFEDEIIKKKDVLYESVFNESLFNEKKIIFINTATDKILYEISECLDKDKKNTKIYVFAENLDKKSKLRDLFEKEKSLAIIACYEDNEKTLINYINKELYGYKCLTGELANIIITNSSSDRKIIQNEIIKIKDFFAEKIIRKNELLEILNIKNNTGFDQIRDSALSGKKDKINNLLSEIDILEEDSFFYLNNLNFRILKLIEIHKINIKFNDYERTLNSLKPSIFWKDKPVYIEQLKKWSIKKLNVVSQKIEEAEILMKKNSIVRNDIVIKNLIILLSKKASSQI